MHTPQRAGSRGRGSSPTPSLPTPPDSGEKPLPPSSPARTSPSQSLSRLVRLIGSIKRGYCPDHPWIKLRLEPADFSGLKEQLVEDDLWGYFDDKIRFDYDPCTSIFIFRMPSGTHEIFTARVVEEINLQLRRLYADVSRPDLAALAKSIQCCASTDIKFESDLDGDQVCSTRSPDSSFQHSDAKYPCLVIETSFSQKMKDLPRLADDYIIGSHGNIKLVVGLGIEYRGSKRATVSVWQSEEGYEEDRVPYLCATKITNDELFRNDDSSIVLTDTSLTLPLSAFIPPETESLPVPPDAVISIPYSTLYSFLEEAERRQRLKYSGRAKKLQPGTRLRKRQLTPDEQLREKDEARFAESEDEVERKAFEKDDEWGRKKSRRR